MHDLDRPGAAANPADGVADLNIRHPGTITAGFFAGTMIATDEGDVPIDWLRPGDRVLTRDNGYVCLAWVGRPIAPSAGIPCATLVANSLGQGFPSRNLRLPLLHGVLLSSAQFELYFGSSELLVDAGDLTDLAANRHDEPLPFYQIAFATHEVILADGLWVESSDPDAALPDADDRRMAQSARPRLKAWEIRMFDLVGLVSRERAAA